MMMTQDYLLAVIGGGVKFSDLVLLGALEDYIKVIIAIVVGLLWMISQIREAMKKKEPPKPAPRPVIETPTQKANKDEINEQIEEFLRRSQQARGIPVTVVSEEPPRRQDTWQQPSSQPTSQQPARQSMPQQRSSPLPSRSAPQPTTASRRPIEQKPKAKTNADKFEQRAAHLGTFDDSAPGAKFAQDISHLQVKIPAADAVVAPRAAAPVAARQKDVAAVIAGMLRDKQSIRDAIVLAEILTPRGKF